MDIREKILESYASVNKSEFSGGDSFSILLFICLAVFLCTGYYLYSNVPPAKTLEERISQISTSFIFEEKRKEPPKQEKKREKITEQKKTEVPSEPVDLTKNPVLDQKTNDIVEPQDVPKDPPKEVRRVYGLKRVYSTGLGSGGSAADAVIGKLGNTLNAPIDTFTVSKEEIKGQLVSVTTITTLPKIKKVVKPEYTKEMADNHVEGVVKVKVLVDIDGKVKKAIVQNDIGFGTKESVYNACMELEFEPAKIDGTPCAVWILVPFTFRMLN